MRKRFIALIDFSDNSKQLLQLVYSWSQTVGAELSLVHQVVTLLPAMGETDDIEKLKRRHQQDALDRLKSFAYSVIGAESAVRFYVDTAHLTSIIERLEEPDTVDYLFVGMTDRSLLDRLFLRSTVSDLSTQLDKIILAFPHTATNISIDQLYVGVAEKHPLNEAAFQNLIHILKGVTKEIHFFSAIRPQDNRESAEQHLQQLRTRYNVQIKTSCNVLVDQNPMKHVKAYMAENRGLLAIQKGSRALTDLFRRYWTTEIINTASIPVIILPNDQ